jgi:hypothetical protein
VIELLRMEKVWRDNVFVENLESLESIFGLLSDMNELAICLADMNIEFLEGRLRGRRNSPSASC